MAELERFFKSINYVDKKKAFQNATIDKVILKKDKEEFIVVIKNLNVLPYEEVSKLFLCSENGINNQNKCQIILTYDEIFEDDIVSYLKEYLNQLIQNHPALAGLVNAQIEFENAKISIKVASKYEQSELLNFQKDILNYLEKYGFKNCQLEILIDEIKEQNLKKQIANEKNSDIELDIISPAVQPEIKINKTEKTISLDSVFGEEKNIGIDALVFGLEAKELASKKKPGNFVYVINLKLTDKTSSILGKMVKFNNDKYLDAKNKLKEGKWYHFSGNIEQDSFLHDLVFNVRDFEEIPSKDVVISDNAPIKRVELHAHTMMSLMDGVIPFEEKNKNNIINYAIKLGHKAVAITDHNCVQAFPEVFHTVTHYNKDKEKEYRFKALYGSELNVVNNDVDVIFNLQDYNLLNDTYIVFDTETTGFYVGTDQMIEIGAVKIKNGEIIDRFDELIDPHRPLPKKIVELTCITDEMVAGKDNEENVTKRFLDWAGDNPMVAHNAKFDIGFISAACKKYGFKDFTNTVIDTMSLARMLNPEWPNHKLQTLVRKYNIPWDEEAHHRADYDAEGTAKAFIHMARLLYNQNIETTTDIYNSVDLDELVKFSYPFHLNILAQNKKGLKNLFKIISLANTKYLFRNDQPKIPRDELTKHREGILIGSGCINGEIFEAAKTKEDEELVNIMQFYDYIEVQPITSCLHLLQMEASSFKTINDLQEHIRKIIRVAKEAGKIVCATSDAHHLTKEDKIYRDIIVKQKTNGRLHPLNRRGVDIPDMHFYTTEEMLEEFQFLGEELAYEIVVTNTNKIADMIEEIEVIIDTGGVPFSPKIDKSVETVMDLVYSKANEWYGNPLPHNIEERIAKELYGDSLINAIKYFLEQEKKSSTDDEVFNKLHETIIKGDECVKQTVRQYLKETNEIKTDEQLDKLLKKTLGGVIGGNFDVIYLIAQKLVKHSNDAGFLVGSRGSVGSSFVATLMGITEVNPLPAHYRCEKCQTSIFDNEEGKPLGAIYSSGFDMPEKMCPNCGAKMLKDGQDMPFATFLGFNADKVPDIDLNFSDLNQADAHEYTKELFGVDNVYRAGTIGTVATKTAFGFVKGYCEEKNIMLRNIEIERLAQGCTGVKRTTGQHPGGIVVIPGYMDVFDFTPFQFPADDPDSNWRTTHFDYHAIDQDVLKLDILGHSGPTQLRMIQNLTGDDVTKVPLDDKKTMEIFQSTEPLGVTADQILNDTGTLGIPEFGTTFTIQLVRDTKPKTFAELVKISGLSHGTDVWLGNAQELIKNNIVPFSDVIGCRDDIMVYLMYNGLKPIQAFEIMEFVRKGKASKDKEKWEKYKKIMNEANIPEWFINSCAKIKYMFPKAHAVAYVMSAFRIAYYKVHNPVVYYASQFSTQYTDFEIETMIKGYDAIKARVIELNKKGYDLTNKEQAVLETLKVALEAAARGFKFGNIDLEKSQASDYVISDDGVTLICPFMAIDGLGAAVAHKIVEERDIKPFYSIEDFQIRGKVNSTTVDKLKLLNVFGTLPETSQLSLF